MDYTGLWTSASTLAITLTNDTCCTDARLGETSASLVDQMGRLVRNAGGNPNPNLYPHLTDPSPQPHPNPARNAGGNSAAARGAALLSGSFGEAERPPQISAFYLEVPSPTPNHSPNPSHKPKPNPYLALALALP